MKPVKRTYTAYQSLDGSIHDTEDAALKQDNLYLDEKYRHLEEDAICSAEDLDYLPWPNEQMQDIYQDFCTDVYEKLIPDAEPISYEIDNPVLAQLSYESDLRHLLLSFELDEIKALMEPILAKYGLHKIYMYRLCDIPSAIKSVEIRKDWEKAIRNTKDMTDVNSILRWSFCKNDIKELAKLHKAGKFRKKIENLLTGANFHQESGDFHDHKYDDYLD